MNSSHNQANSATRGGQGSIPTPANSGGSGIFGSTGIGATHGSSPTTSKSTSDGSGARRGSQEQGGMFGNLSSLKRNSLDQNITARRSSLTEQGPQPGMLGKMWNNFTKGNGEEK